MGFGVKFIIYKFIVKDYFLIKTKISKPKTYIQKFQI